MFIDTKVISMSAEDMFYHAPVIDLGDGPFSFNLFLEDVPFNYTPLAANHLWVVGCSVVANLVDLATNLTIDTCLSICLEDEDMPSLTCNGTGCCNIAIPWNLTSFAVQLTRLNPSELHLANASNITAFISDLHESPRNETVIGWYMNDEPSCEEAMKHNNTYACVGINSLCYGLFPSDIGYSCKCSFSYLGNPYVPDGCPDLTATIHPAKSCNNSRCGALDIPFPFGLDESCSRGKSFIVKCNETYGGPLLFQDSTIGLRITNISLEEGWVEVTVGSLLSVNELATVPEPFHFSDVQVIFDWVIGYETCVDAEMNRTTYACLGNNSGCWEKNHSMGSIVYPGYICKCATGYAGNPYIYDGCQDIDECKQPEKYVCNGLCINTLGGYICTCPPGTTGDPKRGSCNAKDNIVLDVVIGTLTGSGVLLLIGSFLFISQRWKRRIQKKMRERNFIQNHGLLLEQLLASDVDVADKTKIFSLQELEKATNNFDDARVVGRGGHGTVYKGILSDQRVVAIKKAKIVMKRETDQFINEVAILSQINHRNVVKLYGCCLETEAPLLVYEFISNGTLWDHLHNLDRKSTLSWEERIRIATETAGALSYLHSSASISIFHRDIKSSNILLDDYYTAKVSDFGASRSIPLDETRVVTGIQGTFGYLDPEYFQTSELTEKSDVYSFGVILVELLTGEKPILSTASEEDRNLSMHFLRAVKENSFYELMEDRVKREATEEELDESVQLAELCLKFKGNERPTMKEVEIILQGLRKAIKHKKGQWSTEGKEEIISLLSDYDVHEQFTNISLVGQPNEEAS